MPNKDALWQEAVNLEMRRLRRAPPKLLYALDRFSTRTVRFCGVVIDLARVHEVHSTDLPPAPGPDGQPARKSRGRRPQRVTHSFIVRAQRTVFFFFGKRTYLRGFSLDEAGKVIPIDPELLRSFQ